MRCAISTRLGVASVAITAPVASTTASSAGVDALGAGRTSLAFALRMRAPDRTLSAAEVAEVRQGALEAAQRLCGAVLRA